MTTKICPLVGAAILALTGPGFSQLPSSPPPPPPAPRASFPTEIPIRSASKTTAAAGPHVSMKVGLLHSRMVADLKERVPTLDSAKLRPPVTGSWEMKVLDASMGAVGTCLHTRVGDLAGYYTVQTDQGDVLIARFAPGDADGPEREIWLWDGPRDNFLILRVDPSVLAPGKFASYFEGVPIWDGEPIALTSAELYVNPGGAALGIAGTGKHRESEIGGLSWTAAAFGDPRGAYIGILMSKAFTSWRYPLGAYLVPERFPPLEERLKSLPRPTLFDELGGGPAHRQYSGYFAVERDRLILREIMSRGPVSDREIEQIILGVCRG